MMSFLKGQGYKNLQKLKYPQMKELYDKVQASIKDSFKDFVPMDSEKEREMLKERDAQRLSRKRKATITEEQPSKKPKLSQKQLMSLETIRVVASDDLRGALSVIYLIFTHSRGPIRGGRSSGPAYYSEYMPQEDEVFLTEEQPLPVAASPTSQSPDYVPKSDLEADPEEDDDEDPKEDPIDYPADRGDDDKRAVIAAARLAGGLRAYYGFVATMDREIRRDLKRDVGYGSRSWDEIIDEQSQRTTISWTSDLARAEVMSLCTTVLAQQSEIRELQSADRRKANQCFQVTGSKITEGRRQLIEALKLVKSLQTQMAEFERQQGPAKGPAVTPPNLQRNRIQYWGATS
ncbi:hypothetical protein Tco_0078990 [Tanacetum coccineum]